MLKAGDINFKMKRKQPMFNLRDRSTQSRSPVPNERDKVAVDRSLQDISSFTNGPAVHQRKRSRLIMFSQEIVKVQKPLKTFRALP